MSDARYIQVAVPVPVQGLFTYRAPDGVVVGPGHRVRVPFGRRKLVGLVVEGPTPEAPQGLTPSRVKVADEVLDEVPLIAPPLMRLAAWLADYYQAPPGEAFSLLLPPRMGGGRTHEVTPLKEKTVELVSRTAKRGAAGGARLGARMAALLDHLAEHGETPWPTLSAATGAGRDVLRRLVAKELVAVREESRNRVVLPGAIARDTPPRLTGEQTAAIAAIQAFAGQFHGVLLHGVTGSGKTEVYLRLIRTALDAGQGALVLVPEIALTPQLVGRFRARLGDAIAVQHSGLLPEARQEQWQRIESGDLKVVIGARSALFAPVRDLGVIIVDEAHESSFKQDTSPRYHARNLALVRGQIESVPVVLGSATPSAESWANVAKGRLTHIRLAERVHLRPMPEVEVVDLRETAFADPDRLFSAPLAQALESVVGNGDQAIVFLNRRGFSSFVLCRACGEKLDCTSCSVTYTWHRGRGRMVCHYCDRSVLRPAVCPACNADALAEVGFGTEQVEARLTELHPTWRLARMDRDTTRGSKLPRLLDRFRSGAIDVLIGTQMVAKGHDFPNVTLVGVLLAEQGLAFPDFRAAERTFQLMTQIAGRAGRAEKPGRVIIQTYMPRHYAVKHAVDHDTEAFLAHEITLREARRFPPSTHLALYRLGGNDLQRVAGAARHLGEALIHAAAQTDGAAWVHPPQPAPIERIKQQWRFQVLVNATSRRALRHVLGIGRRVEDGGTLPKGVRIALDVDPLNFL